TACRARFRLLVRPLSSSEFDIREPQARDYLSNLKALLTKNDLTLFGNVSGTKMQRLRETGELYERAELLCEEIMSLERLKKAPFFLSLWYPVALQIWTNIIPIEKIDTREVLLEFNPGVGGQEAMFFNEDLMNMYVKFTESTMGWNVQIIDKGITETGGLRHGTLSVSGQNAGRILKLEGGVHRVQRIPRTEKSGRIHTSTATVAVLPCPEEVDMDANIDTKDLIIKTKRSGGPGGQHVNKTESAVQILHVPTGERSSVQ
ncbi:peptide chain release factor 1-like, partial [Tropilaelaps mercedesae]